MDAHITRDFYIQELLDSRSNGKLKILTGIHRSGKTRLLIQFEKELLKLGIQKDHITLKRLANIRFEKECFQQNFYEHLRARMYSDATNYLLLDEPQDVESWELALHKLQQEFDLDIYVAASNSHSFKAAKTTLFQDALQEICVYPLSFAEYCSSYQQNHDDTTAMIFTRYLLMGGMPTLLPYTHSVSKCKQALEGIYATILVRDIYPYSSLQVNQDILHALMYLLAQRIGYNSSANSLAADLSHNQASLLLKGLKPTSKTVTRYLDFLEDAYFCYSAKRFDIDNNEVLKTLDKIYFADLAFRNFLLGFDEANKAQLLENLVFLELKRRRYDVYLGKIGRNSINFVAEKAGCRSYIQLLMQPDNYQEIESVLRPLNQIRKIVDPSCSDFLILSAEDVEQEELSSFACQYLLDWLLD